MKITRLIILIFILTLMAQVLSGQQKSLVIKHKRSGTERIISPDQKIIISNNEIVTQRLFFKILNDSLLLHGSDTIQLSDISIINYKKEGSMVSGILFTSGGLLATYTGLGIIYLGIEAGEYVNLTVGVPIAAIGITALIKGYGFLKSGKNYSIDDWELHIK